MLFDLLRVAAKGVGGQEKMELCTSFQVNEQPLNCNGQNDKKKVKSQRGKHQVRVSRHHSNQQQKQQQQQPQLNLNLNFDLNFNLSGHSLSAVASSQPVPESRAGTQSKPLDLSVRGLKQSSGAGQPVDLVAGHESRAKPKSEQNHFRFVQQPISSSASPSSPSSSSSSSSSSAYSASSSCSSEVISSSNLSSSNNIHADHHIDTHSDKSIARGRHHQQHKKQKGATKSHLCNQCGRCFSRSDMLTRHSRLHSGLKPYQCSKCKQVFSRSDHLSTHERTHTGEKPYQCEFCAYSACRRDMITRHMRTHRTKSSSDPTKPRVAPNRKQKCASNSGKKTCNQRRNSNTLIEAEEVAVDIGDR